MTTPKRKSYIPDNFKTVRLFDKALVQSTEMIKDFERQGHTASWTSVTNAAINLMHSAMIEKKVTVVSTAEIVERRAHDVGNCIAILLGTLCLANVSMAGCQLLYYKEADSIGIRMDAIDDVLIYLGGGASPALVANTVNQVLRERGYMKDDGSDVVNMEQLFRGETPMPTV